MTGTVNILDVISRFCAEADIEIKISAEVNLLEILDSMDLVRLIMFSEEHLLKSTGIEVQLADENTFDFEVSPLLSVSAWESYVMQEVENAQA